MLGRRVYWFIFFLSCLSLVAGVSTLILVELDDVHIAVIFIPAILLYIWATIARFRDAGYQGWIVPAAALGIPCLAVIATNIVISKFSLCCKYMNRQPADETDVFVSVCNAKDCIGWEADKMLCAAAIALLVVFAYNCRVCAKPTAGIKKHSGAHNR